MKRDLSDKEALDQIADGISQFNELRLTELNNLKQIQEIKNEVQQREAKRLQAKHGETHPLAQKMVVRTEYNQSVFTALDKEIERSSVKTESLPANGWRLHGKVLGKGDQPMPDITVFFAEENKEWIRELGSSCSDQTGYYAITLTEEQIDKIGRQKTLYLAASDKQQQVVYHQVNANPPTKGVINYEDIYLVANGVGCTPPPDVVK